MSEAGRDAFEAWARNNITDTGSIVRSVFNKDKYITHTVQAAWLSWQAACKYKEGKAENDAVDILEKIRDVVGDLQTGNITRADLAIKALNKISGKYVQQ